MQVRLFTPHEANRLIPRLELLVARARKLTDDLRAVRDQLVDLRIVWDDKIEDPSCPDHAEYVSFKTKFETKEGELQEAFAEFDAVGCEVKDLENGLVDFNTRRGEEIVYLCWKAGEKEIKAWHAHDSGYSARRPISEF